MDTKKILIVEDDDLIVKVLQRKLKKLQTHSKINYNLIIDYAEDGEVALEKASSMLPDIILLDVKIPKINGIDVCKKLKQNRKTKKITIFILSALAQQQDMQRGLDAGADKYIKKPINYHSLIQEILALWPE